MVCTFETIKHSCRLGCLVVQRPLPPAAAGTYSDLLSLYFASAPAPQCSMFGGYLNPCGEAKPSLCQVG